MFNFRFTSRSPTGAFMQIVLFQKSAPMLFVAILVEWDQIMSICKCFLNCKYLIMNITFCYFLNCAVNPITMEIIYIIYYIFYSISRLWHWLKQLKTMCLVQEQTSDALCNFCLLFRGKNRTGWEQTLDDRILSFSFFRRTIPLNLSWCWLWNIASLCFCPKQSFLLFSH